MYQQIHIPLKHYRFSSDLILEFRVHISAYIKTKCVTKLKIKDNNNKTQIHIETFKNVKNICHYCK